MMRPRALFVPALAVLLCNSAAAQVKANTEIIQDDINGSFTPPNSYWIISSIGWTYTPAETYWLSAAYTNFAARATYEREVIFELMTAPHFEGGEVLRTGSFLSSSAGGFEGASFESFLMEAGKSYYLGFRRISDMGVNFTDDPFARRLDAEYLGGYDGVVGRTDVNRAPLLRLAGPATVTPEPTSMILLGSGLAGLAAFRRRRRRRED